MKVSARIGLIVSVLILGACGFQSSAPSKDYLTTEVVKTMDCNSVDKTQLQDALAYVEGSSGRQVGALLDMNQGATSLDPLKEVLRNKIGECNGVLKKEIKGSGDPAPWPCPEHMKQNFDPNKDGNFASNGVNNTNDILALSGRDARALAFYAHRSNLVASDDPSPLLIPDNTCLSQAGQEAWNMLKGALTASGTKVNLDAQAPENYYNTGMVNGQPVVDTHPGIGGDRAAIEYTFPDGTKLIVLKRCSNLALPSQGDLPQAVTNHQRPPGTTVTPPPTTTKPVCPPDMPHGTPPNCKDDPVRDPAQQGSAPVGNGQNQDQGAGAKQPYTPPPATTYQAPPPPPGTTAAPPPAVTPTQPTGQQPTVAPPTQPTKTGAAPTDPGCGNPGFC